MKRTFSTLSLLFLVALFLFVLPQKTLAQTTTVSCDGNVTDVNGNPISGVLISIFPEGIPERQDPCFVRGHPLAGQGNAVARTDDSGYWLYTCNEWPSLGAWRINRVEFVRFNYQITARFIIPADFSCQVGDVSLTRIPAPGFTCDSSSGNCNYVPTGLYDDSATCSINCGSVQPLPIPPSGIFCPVAGGGQGINTAFGCVPYNNLTNLSAFITRLGIGLGGGVGFLLIIYAGFLIITSGGDQAKLKSGKELLTAAIAGLLLIIFSIFILELFGLRILRLPGF